MKHTLTTAACAAGLVVGLAGCGSGNDKAALPNTTASSSPSATATSQPTLTSPTATTTGPTVLAPHSTYTYGDLQLIVNLPVDIPTGSRPSIRTFSDFLQGVGRTTAQNKLDPSLSGLASADVVKERKNAIEKTSVQGIGPVIFTVSNIHTVPHGPTLISGCLDQSKLVQIRKDGSTYVDASTKKYGTLRMSATISAERASLEVTSFAFAKGTC